jgi:hypothetical protein
MVFISESLARENAFSQIQVHPDHHVTPIARIAANHFCCSLVDALFGRTFAVDRPRVGWAVPVGHRGVCRCLVLVLMSACARTISFIKIMAHRQLHLNLKFNFFA